MIYLHQGCEYAKNWDKEYAKLLKKNNLAYKVIDVRQIKKVNKSDFLLGRYDESCLDIKQIYPQLTEIFSGRLYPEPFAMELYDDKWKQYELLHKDFPMPKTIWAESFTETQFPIVCKKLHGSSSKNVTLANKQEEIPYPCLLQEFCDGNDGDIRIYVIGKRTLGFKRLNFKNDFKASGSGCISPLTELPEDCVKISNSICKKYNFHTMCFDFVLLKKTWVLLEISYTFVDAAIKSYCHFYLDNKSNKIFNVKSPQEWIVSDLFQTKLL